MRKDNILTQFFFTENDMLVFASKLAKLIPPGTIIFLYGQLGAGKTTFTRGLLRGMGYENRVKSPTYTLVEPYHIQGNPLFHFDFYRINNAFELQNMGIEEYFTPDAVCIIEWPEKGDKALPDPDLACYISFEGTSRQMILETKSDKGRGILAKLLETGGSSQ